MEWSTNEKAALEMLAGASYCGARVLFTCKQVGLNVASDALMSLNYVGTGGGCVLFVADDPGPHLLPNRAGHAPGSAPSRRCRCSIRLRPSRASP